jgi:hypothetical protein
MLEGDMFAEEVGVIFTAISAVMFSVGALTLGWGIVVALW